MVIIRLENELEKWHLDISLLVLAFKLSLPNFIKERE
jgi:hypothetical protein